MQVFLTPGFVTSRQPTTRGTEDQWDRHLYPFYLETQKDDVRQRQQFSERS